MTKGDRVRGMMKDTSWTNAEIARRTGASYQYVHTIRKEMEKKKGLASFEEFNKTVNLFPPIIGPQRYKEVNNPISIEDIKQVKSLVDRIGVEQFGRLVDVLN